MRIAILVVIGTGFTFSTSQAGEKPPDVSRIYGKVQIVSVFPDYRVRVVRVAPDLKVEAVKEFPSAQGKWQFVNSFPDFKVQFVRAGEDFTVEIR